MSDTTLHIIGLVVCGLGFLVAVFVIIAHNCFDDNDKDMDWYDSYK